MPHPVPHSGHRIGHRFSYGWPWCVRPAVPMHHRVQGSYRENHHRPGSPQGSDMSGPECWRHIGPDRVLLYIPEQWRTRVRYLYSAWYPPPSWFNHIMGAGIPQWELYKFWVQAVMRTSLILKSRFSCEILWLSDNSMKVPLCTLM